MSYLLWQIFACLLFTALIFLALGWLLRDYFRRNVVANDPIHGSERASWQTSLDGLKARLEAETGRKLAAEKALDDARGQASKLSSLLDQHTIEIRNLSQDIRDKNRALDEHDANLRRMHARIADLSALQDGTRDFTDERDAFTSQITALTSQVIASDQSLRDANEELAELKALVNDREELQAQVVDLESKLRIAAEENGELKIQVSELTPKLAMAAAAGAEVVSLKAHVAQLEPQISKLQTSDVELNRLRSQLADIKPRLAAATTVAAEVTTLKEHIVDLETKLAKAQASQDELANFKRRWVEHEGKFHAVGEENSRLKSQLAEYEPKLKQAEQQYAEFMMLRIRIGEMEPKVAEADSLHNRVAELEPQIESLEAELQTVRMRLTTIEPQIHDWETRYTTVVAEKDAELSQCRSRVAELDGQLSKNHVKPATHNARTKTDRDDLKKIYGIGPVLEKRLNGLGVNFYREIAMWTKEDILRFEEHLKEFADRIERDKWVEGAREQHFKKYGETLFDFKSAQA